MIEYLIRKYWKGAVVAVLLFLISKYTYKTLDEAFTGFVCLFMFAWLMCVIFVAKASPRRGIILISGLPGLLKLIWYVCSLKPLRRWLFRLYYVGLTPKPYPYLALYGSLLDTHMMKYKLSAAFYRDKTKAARAALWRLLSRGAIRLGTDNTGNAAIKLGTWVDSPSDGLDQSLERALYNFLVQSRPLEGVLNPAAVREVMTHVSAGASSVSWKKTENRNYDNDNQYRFADLLNTGISLKAYSRRDVRNIFGMKRFLKNISKNYGKYVVPELADAAATGSEMPELSRVWPEYMTYAYLFGIEKDVTRQITRMLPADESSQLLHQLANSGPYREAWRKLLYQVSVATPAMEDVVAAKLGLLPIAWHAKEIYDI